MKRTAYTALLIAAISFVSPRSALADGWGWLEQFSGPGPYQGYTFLATYCGKAEAYRNTQTGEVILAANENRAKQEADAARKNLVDLQTKADLLTADQRVDLQLALAKAAEAQKKFDQAEEYGKVRNELFGYTEYQSVGRRPCFFADFGRFHADPDDKRQFPRIDLDTFDFGGAFRFWDSIDIGAGIGVMHIKPRGHKSTYKLTVTPFRISMRPLMMIADSRYRRPAAREALALLSVYWKGTFVMGPLREDTFGLPEKTFQVTADFVQSAGATIDGTAAYYLGRRGVRRLLGHQ